MKNKKGFTLIEIIVTIALLGLIGSVIAINIVNINKKQENQEESRITSTLKAAAEAYVKVEKITENCNLGIDELIEESYIKESEVEKYKEDYYIEVNIGEGKYKLVKKEDASGKSCNGANKENYALKYDLMGGIDEGNNFTTKNYKYNETVKIPNVEPKKEGYKFNGWSIDGISASYYPGNTFNIKKSMTLKAIWNNGFYNITYNKNTTENVTNMPNNIKDIEHNTLIHISGNIPVRVGYNFLGWSTSEGGEVKYSANSEYIVTNNLNLYAKWEEGIYTLTLDKQGGNGGESAIYEKYSKGIYKDSAATQGITKVNIPTREGYEFKGYYESPNGIGKQLIDAGGNITSNLNNKYTTANKTIYASWEVKKYNITYNKNTTDEVSNMPANNENVAYNSRIHISGNIPVRAGYNFLGWSTSESGEVKYSANSEYIVTNNLNLYAKWEAKEYTSTFTTTSNLKTTTHTATLSCSSELPIKGYYFGTNSNVTSNTYKSVTQSTNISVRETINKKGKYYFTCVNSENIKSTTSNKTYYEYTINNYLNIVNKATGSYTTTNYEKIGSSSTYLAPENTSINGASVYTIPTGANSGTYKGMSSGTASTSSASVSKNNKKLTSNSTYNLWFDRQTFNITVATTEGGSNKVTSENNKSGVTATSKTSNKVINVKYNEKITATATITSDNYFDFKNLSGVISTSNSTATANITQNGTITANFTRIIKTITLNKQGGIGGTNTIYRSGKKGTDLYLDSTLNNYFYPGFNSIVVPQKSGYEFKGYYTSSSGGILVINKSGDFVYGNLGNLQDWDGTTLYAQWTKIYTVTVRVHKNAETTTLSDNIKESGDVNIPLTNIVKDFNDYAFDNLKCQNSSCTYTNNNLKISNPTNNVICDIYYYKKVNLAVSYINTYNSDFTNIASKLKSDDIPLAQKLHLNIEKLGINKNLETEGAKDYKLIGGYNYGSDSTNSKNDFKIIGILGNNYIFLGQANTSPVSIHVKIWQIEKEIDNKYVPYRNCSDRYYCFPHNTLYNSNYNYENFAVLLYGNGLSPGGWNKTSSSYCTDNSGKQFRFFYQTGANGQIGIYSTFTISKNDGIKGIPYETSFDPNLYTYSSFDGNCHGNYPIYDYDRASDFNISKNNLIKELKEYLIIPANNGSCNKNNNHEKICDGNEKKAELNILGNSDENYYVYKVPGTNTYRLLVQIKNGLLIRGDFSHSNYDSVWEVTYNMDKINRYYLKKLTDSNNNIKSYYVIDNRSGEFSDISIENYTDSSHEKVINDQFQTNTTKIVFKNGNADTTDFLPKSISTSIASYSNDHICNITKKIKSDHGICSNTLDCTC